MYFIFYIFLLYIPLFNISFFMCLWVIYRIPFIIGYFLFYVLFWGSMIISRISMIFIFVCDHWLYVIILAYDYLFLFFMCCFGVMGIYNILVIWMIIYIIELGFIYSISFLFVFFGMSVRDSFIILEV